MQHQHLYSPTITSPDGHLQYGAGTEGNAFRVATGAAQDVKLRRHRLALPCRQVQQGTFLVSFGTAAHSVPKLCRTGGFRVWQGQCSLLCNGRHYNLHGLTGNAITALATLYPSNHPRHAVCTHSDINELAVLDYTHRLWQATLY